MSEYDSWKDPDKELPPIDEIVIVYGRQDAVPDAGKTHLLGKGVDRVIAARDCGMRGRWENWDHVMYWRSLKDVLDELEDP